jgi:NaMN:DMB phosphoribosyltransferase
MARAQKRWDSIAKPLASLGRLEETVVRIAGMTRSAQIDIGKRCVAIMCADNGVVAQGVTQTDASITAIMTGQFALGNTTVCVMAKAAGADVVPVDIGVARDVQVPGVVRRKVRYGTRDHDRGPRWPARRRWPRLRSASIRRWPSRKRATADLHRRDGQRQHHHQLGDGRGAARPLARGGHRPRGGAGRRGP